MSKTTKRVLLVALFIVLILRNLIQGATISILNDNIATSDKLLEAQQETIDLQEQEIQILENKIEELTGDAPAEENTSNDMEMLSAWYKERSAVTAGRSCYIKVKLRYISLENYVKYDIIKYRKNLKGDLSNERVVKKE